MNGFMSLTGLELSTELYKLSGWDDCRWCFRDVSDTGTPHWLTDLHTHEHDQCFPQYDLGYLIRKIPAEHFDLVKVVDSPEYIYYIRKNGAIIDQIGADTPENATAKLAIELFKNGTLTKETI